MMRREPEHTLYLFGTAAAAAGAAVFLLYCFFPQLRACTAAWSCPIFRLLGLYCPGCGGTRALLALLRGRPLQSFLLHPAVITGLGIYLSFMASHTAERLTGGRVRGIRWRNLYLWIWIGVLALNWLVKNVLLLQGIPVLELLSRM